MSSWNPLLVVAVVIGCGAIGVYLRLAADAPRVRRVGTVCLVTTLFVLLVIAVLHAPVTDSPRWEANLQLAACLFLGTGSLAAAALCVTSRRIGQAVAAFQVLLVSNAGLFAFAQAPFPAVFAILVLVGGVGILFTLAATRFESLSGGRKPDLPREPLLACLASAVLAVAAIGSAYEATTSETDGRQSAPQPTLPTRGTIDAVLHHVPHAGGFDPADSRIGTLDSILFGEHIPALQIAAVLMFVALVGSSLIVRFAKRPISEPRSEAGAANSDE